MLISTNWRMSLSVETVASIVALIQDGRNQNYVAKTGPQRRTTHRDDPCIVS